MAYSNQFTFDYKKAELIEITFSGDVELRDDTLFKVVALIRATGQESESDELQVVFFGKPAEIVFGLNDGDFIDLSCKVKTRWIEPRNGGNGFFSTECLAYFVELHKDDRERSRHQGSRTQGQQQQQRRSGGGGNNAQGERRRGGNGNNGRRR